MNIRPVQSEQDILEAYEIEFNAYPPGVSATLEAFRMRSQAFGGYFLVAEENGKIAGVTNGVKINHTDLSDEGLKQVSAFDPDGPYFCILTIAVHPHHQRKGIASMLLKQVIETAKNEQLQGIVLMCEGKLIPFYEKHGFIYRKPSHSEHGGIRWHEMSLTLQIS